MTYRPRPHQPHFHLLYCNRKGIHMISEKQLEANRRNAQRSTGPQSVEGKAKSSRNNLRHGLTGQISLLPTEDREAHDRAEVGFREISDRG